MHAHLYMTFLLLSVTITASLAAEEDEVTENDLVDQEDTDLHKRFSSPMLLDNLRQALATGNGNGKGAHSNVPSKRFSSPMLLDNLRQALNAGNGNAGNHARFTQNKRFSSSMLVDNLRGALNSKSNLVPVSRTHNSGLVKRFSSSMLVDNLRHALATGNVPVVLGHKPRDAKRFLVVDERAFPIDY